MNVFYPSTGFITIMMLLLLCRNVAEKRLFGLISQSGKISIPLGINNVMTIHWIKNGSWMPQCSLLFPAFHALNSLEGICKSFSHELSAGSLMNFLLVPSSDDTTKTDFE